jgi:hypothetical protein
MGDWGERPLPHSAARDGAARADARARRSQAGCERWGPLPPHVSILYHYSPKAPVWATLPSTERLKPSLSRWGWTGTLPKARM